MTSSFKALFY